MGPAVFVSRESTSHSIKQLRTGPPWGGKGILLQKRPAAGGRRGDGQGASVWKGWTKSRQKQYTKETMYVEKVSFWYSKCTILEVRDCVIYAKEHNIYIKLLTKLRNTDIINAIGKRYYFIKEGYNL